MITIIGISGRKGSGKDAILDCVRVHFPDVQRIAFADALKEEVCQKYMVKLEYLEQHKDNFRLILQGHGTDYRRKLFGDDYWIQRWLQRVNQSEASLIVCPDVRFVNEVEIVKKLNGHLWRVERPDLPATDNHMSECALDIYGGFDRHIKNDKSLKRLQIEVDLALEMSGLL